LFSIDMVLMLAERRLPAKSTPRPKRNPFFMGLCV
jgi:hypothetical protein